MFFVQERGLTNSLPIVDFAMNYYSKSGNRGEYGYELSPFCVSC